MDKVGLKIGGSVATCKGVKQFPLDIKWIKKRTKEFIKAENNRRIARYELLPVIGEVNIAVIGFGVGPFGHFLVERWDKLKDKNVVHDSVSYYCSILVDLYREAGLHLEYDEKHSPNHLCYYENGRLNVDKLSDWIEKLNKKGKIAVTHGDMVPEKNGRYDGLEVASADIIIPQVAIKLGLKRIVAGTDVDGLYTYDPKTDSKARLIERIKAYGKLDYAEAKGIGTDVTGRIPRKVEDFQEAAKHGIPGYIVNALVRGRIRNALLGKEVYGTLILP